MNNRLATIVALLLMIAIGMVIMGSWVASSLGLGVQNALSFEGLRWLFVHALDDVHNFLPTCLLFLLMLGLLQDMPKAWPHLLSALLLMIVLLLSCPLLGLTGHIYPSPFLRGLLPIFSFIVIMLCILSGWFSGRLLIANTFRQLTHSLARFIPWLVIVLMALFLYNLFQFVR